MSVQPLQLALTQAEDARVGWEVQAELKDWESSPAQPTVSQQQGFFRQMFLGGLGAKKPDQSSKR